MDLQNIIVAALIGGIASMWVWVKSFMSKSMAKHDACEKDRDVLNAKAAGLLQKQSELNMRIAIFETCPNSPCGARDAVQRAASTYSLSKQQ